ncbi:MAG TPA: hypothetical protein VFE92_10525 [Dermatophilaceae bacterium]|jgi:hypothetical protein|nr:hypothetical protein [Dermatophilaceae bacterium]
MADTDGAQETVVGSDRKATKYTPVAARMTAKTVPAMTATSFLDLGRSVLEASGALD